MLQQGPPLKDDPRMLGLADEIHSLEVVLKHLMNTDIGNVEYILKTTTSLAKLKETQQKIMTERLLLDLNSLKQWLAKLFDKLKMNLSTTQYSKVVADLLASPAPVNKSLRPILETVLDEKDMPQFDMEVTCEGVQVRQPSLPGSPAYVKAQEQKQQKAIGNGTSRGNI